MLADLRFFFHSPAGTTECLRQEIFYTSFAESGLFAGHLRSPQKVFYSSSRFDLAKLDQLHLELQ